MWSAVDNLLRELNDTAAPKRLWPVAVQNRKEKGWMAKERVEPARA